MKIEIRMSQPDALVMMVKIGEKLTWHELWLPENIDHEAIIPWMLSNIGPLLKELPLGPDDIRFVMGKVLADKYGKEFNTFAAYLDKTSEVIEGLQPMKGERILFVNVSEDLRYRSFYDLMAKRTDTLYMNLDLGFDRSTRTWKKMPTMPITEFVKYLAENRVKTIVTVNHYLIDRFKQNENILLPAVLMKLGVKLITIENDPSDLRPWGFFIRKAWNNPEWPMFSNLHCLNREWDTRHQNCNITPIAIPQDYSGKTRNLRDDYRIVVLSNSRWESVKGAKEKIDWLFANMENPWAELTVWYMALRRMILGMDLREYERLFANSMAHQFFWVCAQDLKYQVIKALKTNRQIDVYGDVGWKNVCPEYYRGSLDNQQIDELFEKDDFMLLLANCSFTYQDASGPVYDVIRRGIHWANFPTIKTDKLKGLEAIEYDTPERLNELVNDIKPPFSKAEESLKYYRDLLSLSVDDLINGIIGCQRGVAWPWELNRHQNEIEKTLDAYTDTHEPLLRACFRMMKL